ncbi:MAG: NAD(P)H-dependent oxidoreductase [Chloroflexi bacterium]|nr:NAD(P)H-dependent oxidoreductase [Chloroflexota bacterium]MDA1270291.1 NAD(P)H-dependent oxidoreductase [Chloroflexota bacterium]
MPTLLGIHGTVTSPGRLHQALEMALAAASASDPSVTAGLLHLGGHQISFADGRPPEAYGDDTQKVLEQVMAADMYLIATPIFRASFTGALKNLLDHVPVEGLMGKACGLIGMGATDHHYLTVDTQLRPVLAWFGAHLVPGGVYLQSQHFQDGKLADPKAIAALESLGRAVVSLHKAASSNSESAGPSPLAAG